MSLVDSPKANFKKLRDSLKNVPEKPFITGLAAAGSQQQSRSRSPSPIRATTTTATPRKTKTFQSRIPESQLNQFSKEILVGFQAQQKKEAYIKMKAQREGLPAFQLRETVLKTIRENRVVIVSGETGCGKSTQVPQFILDDAILKSQGARCKILVTQPRRISAIGLADRVSSERGETMGNSVGYHIRLENKMSDATRILFCTTGILLRRLEEGPDGEGVDGGIDDVSHIIVDEVHERSLDSDFLLMVLKDLLEVRVDLKIILMSATLNAGLFASYFSGAPTVHIPGRTFPVNALFLEDVLAKTKYMPEGKDFVRKGGKSAHHQSPSTLARRGGKAGSASHAEDIYYSGPDAEEGSANSSQASNRGILIFLPGFAEIATLHELLLQNAKIRSGTQNGRLCLALHSTLSSEEQMRVFNRPPDGCVKVVIATNVAETSITIDDVVFVIDSGKMKQTQFDPMKGMASLEECWVSQANATQRRGRAGRVQEGTCIHMFTSHKFANLIEQQPPEIHRTPLEQICLRIKILPFLKGPIAHVLSKVVEPPSKESVEAAISSLRILRALTRDEDLTPLGFHLGRLPVDVRIGKLILFGSMFGCLDSVLTIASAMSVKSPFVAPFEKRGLADKKKQEFATGISDHLTLLTAYNNWLAARRDGFPAERAFLYDNFLSGKTLTMIASVKRQLAELLSDIGFIGVKIRAKELERKGGRMSDGVAEALGENKRGDDQELIKAVLVSALYPNVIKIESPRGGGKAAASAQELKLWVKGNEAVFIHPSSVVFGKYPSGFLVYHEKIKTTKVYIRDCSCVSAFALAFFGGKLTWDKRQRLLNLDDGWIRFSANHKEAAIIEATRTAFDELLQMKIENPELDVSATDLIREIIALVTRNSSVK
ncbi:Asp-Glu-Ala-Asp/His box polypeptide 57 [Obelidium mucronatum]|nr:Asp-Glu-Ala-Asp/His box polypeptide 57 [Obelidium mucronatum]